MASQLELSGVSKRFGQTEALRQVDFSLNQGEVHALLGENGAGKSTLVKIAFGLLQPDAGTIAVAGRVRPVRSPVEARELGIGMVHQHFTSIASFTVAENVALAAGWSVRPEKLRARVRELCADSGLALDPDAAVHTLSAGLKQRLEVLKALAGKARMLLLDEPSSVLSPVDAESLFALIREYRNRGISSVLITHKLPEALDLADRVTVLRRGSVVFSGSTAHTDATVLATHMLGEAPPAAVRIAAVAGAERVRANGLAARRIGVAGTGLKSASFVARAGEVVGIAAVEGNGQRELIRAIVGLAAVDAGTVQVGRPVSFIPEDRTSEALIGPFSLAENLALSQGATAPWVAGPWLRWGAVERRTVELIGAFGVRATGAKASADSLSGGNQQRMVVAAALERRPAVLVAENPTRGLDLRATAEVHARLRAAARNGTCVILHLSDLDELLEVADRILVLAGGVLEEMATGATRMEIGRRMLGALS